MTLETVKQAGAVLFRKREDGELEVLTVRSKKFPDQRIFPKGHIECGESEEVCAARELLEEGGMDGEIVGFAGVREFVFKNKRYNVKYYAARFVSKKHDGEKNRDPIWLTIKDAKDILPFDDLKDVLELAVKVFKNQKTEK